MRSMSPDELVGQFIDLSSHNILIPPLACTVDAIKESTIKENFTTFDSSRAIPLKHQPLSVKASQLEVILTR
jgi:hypothetical protein